MQPLMPETIDAGYVSPLVDLWTRLRSLGFNDQSLSTSTGSTTYLYRELLKDIKLFLRF